MVKPEWNDALGAVLNSANIWLMPPDNENQDNGRDSCQYCIVVEEGDAGDNHHRHHAGQAHHAGQ